MRVNSAAHKFSSKIELLFVVRCIGHGEGWRSQKKKWNKIWPEEPWLGDKRRKRQQTTVNTQQTTGDHSLADSTNIFGHWIWLARWCVHSHTHTRGPPTSRPAKSWLNGKGSATEWWTKDQKVTATNWLMKRVMNRLQIVNHFGLESKKNTHALSIWVVCVCILQKFIMCKYLCIGNTNNAHTISRGH